MKWMINRLFVIEAFISASKHPTVSNSMTSIRKIRLLKLKHTVTLIRKQIVQNAAQTKSRLYVKSLGMKCCA